MSIISNEEDGQITQRKNKNRYNGIGFIDGKWNSDNYETETGVVIDYAYEQNMYSDSQFINRYNERLRLQISQICSRRRF